MKKGLTIMMAAFFLVLMLAGNSQALISGQIWDNVIGYNSSTHDLTNAKFATLGAADASFTVNVINSDSEALTGSYGGPVTYTQFLANSLAGAPGPNGLVWANAASATFGNNQLVTSSSLASFFQFTGTAFFPATFTISKDDGFVLYVNGNLIIDASGPTAPADVPVTLGFAPGVYNFTLNYAAWNGFPEVIQAPSIVTPEPTTMLLLGLGMLGVAAFRRK
jgi:hypothetical protein